jgi:cyclic-di-GMP phosphodiesterase TipF (flagellum assembly factor)
MTRLRAGDDTQIMPADFLAIAERAGLMPGIDNLLLFRCVQVLRRLLMKNREVGLFCNISATTLNDPVAFPQFLQFMEANRALAPSLVLEFTQESFRALGPLESESLASLRELGFRFSMDHVRDLQLSPRELSERGIRFTKVPAGLLLNRVPESADIHTADLSDLLSRHGISLIAERIETETVVLDLLDYDVRFGQGFLFAPPRPVRAEALQGDNEAAERAGVRGPAETKSGLPGLRATA